MFFVFFPYCLVFQHNRTFYYGPFYTQNFQSFFYSLLFSLEGAKTVINYSRLSVFKTDVVCGFFFDICTVVYYLTISKKNVRLAKDAPVTQTFIFLKEAALFNVFLILLNIEKIKITAFAVSHCWSIFFRVLFENSW